MKDYGMGKIRCTCSAAMRKSKSVKMSETSPRRRPCPNCRRMLRVTGLRSTGRMRTPGTTTRKKSRDKERTNAYVQRVEAECQTLRKQVKGLGKRFVNALKQGYCKTCGNALNGYVPPKRIASNIYAPDTEGTQGGKRVEF